MRSRSAVCVAFTIGLLHAQNDTIRLNVPLVVLQAGVTDRSGHRISGLGVEDFTVLDNGEPRAVHLDTSDEGLAPVALVIAIQSSDISAPVLAKIRKVGSTVAEAVVGDNAEAAILSFDGEVKVLQDFTKDREAISTAFENFQPGSGGAKLIDAVDMAEHILRNHSNGRRSNILLISESRDRGSKTRLKQLLPTVEGSPAIIYSLTYSAYLTSFTSKQDEIQPGDFNPLLFITEPARLAKTNTVRALTDATGGRILSFQTKSKLENDLIDVGNEIHNRYILSFSPPAAGSKPEFHRLEVHVKNRSDLYVRVRPGYWSLPANVQH